MSLLVANVVPFARTSRVDTGALRAHLLWLLGSGGEGLAPLADEFLWLDPEEKEQIITLCCDVGTGKPVLPCIWAPSPGQVARLAKHAEASGAMGVILPPPLLHTLQPEALMSWYRTAAMAVHIPIFAWMHPAFGNDLSPTMLERLSGEIGIAGFLDSFGDAFRVRRLAKQFPGRAWLGDDGLAGELRGTHGLAGLVSKAANVWPEMASRLWRGKEELGEAWRARSQALTRAGDVAATKHILRMGVRPPFTEVDSEQMEKLPNAGFMT